MRVPNSHRVGSLPALGFMRMARSVLICLCHQEDPGSGSFPVHGPDREGVFRRQPRRKPGVFGLVSMIYGTISGRLALSELSLQ